MSQVGLKGHLAWKTAKHPSLKNKTERNKLWMFMQALQLRPGVYSSHVYIVISVAKSIAEVSG